MAKIKREEQRLHNRYKDWATCRLLENIIKARQLTSFLFCAAYEEPCCGRWEASRL